MTRPGGSDEGDGQAPSSDGELIARSAAGEIEAFAALFDRKHRVVYLIAYQVLGDAAAAEDVAQEVFVRLWEHCSEHTPGRPLDAWLRRIATNRAIDHWRRRRVEAVRRVHPADGADPDALLEPLGAPQTPFPAPDELHGAQQLQAIWDDLAELLPVRQRAAFVLREIEGASTAEVAEVLGCDASTVRSHVSEARATLGAALRDRYPELLSAAEQDDPA